MKQLSIRADTPNAMLTGSYDPVFVVLSVLIATMASYAALDLAGRVTAAAGVARAGWLAGGASVMGLGVWSMHFVGMLAFHLPNPIAYHLPLVLLSVVVAIAASLLALAVVSRPALAQGTLVPASVLMGIAIAGMHYVGMASMHVAGAVIRYDGGIVSLSVVIAIVASCAALWLAFRLRGVTSSRGRLVKALSALVMGIAISGMHYTGMAGARFHESHVADMPASYVLASEQLGAAVAAVTMLILVLTLIGAVVDRNIQARIAFADQLSQMNARLQRSLNEAEEARREREASAEALRASEARLLQSQKMDAIGNLAGGIAHDFNNLLTVIRLNAEMLLDDLPPERHADHREVMTSVDRATSLTKQLLAYGRRQLLQPAPINLNDVVSGTHKMLRRVIPEDIDIVCELDPDAGFALADRGQIEQVMLNLVINAKDAMPSGGRLVLETRNVTIPIAGSDVGSTLEPGNYVTLAVRDTGVGMTPEVQRRALEPFFTTKPMGEGSGLGLSMVYGLVRQSAGDLSIETVPGAGTIVRIFLPRVAPEKTAEPGIAENTHAVVENQAILIVEDETAVRRATSRLLERSRYRVHEAENGQDALERYTDHLGDIDLVLTDLVMPKMGGLELASRLRVLRPGIRVLFMSGYSREALASTGNEVTPLVHKPFTLATLTSAVSEALEEERVP